MWAIQSIITIYGLLELLNSAVVIAKTTIGKKHTKNKNKEPEKIPKATVGNHKTDYYDLTTGIQILNDTAGLLRVIWNLPHW